MDLYPSISTSMVEVAVGAFKFLFWGGTVQLVWSRVPLALPTTFIVLSFFGLHSWTFALLKKEQCTQTIYWHFDFLNESSLCRHGGFLKWWYPTTMGFPTKNDHFLGVLGVPPLRKHSHVYIYIYMSTMYMSIYLKGPSSTKFFWPPKNHSTGKAQNPLWIPVVNAIKRGVPSQLLGSIILFWWWFQIFF